MTQDAGRTTNAASVSVLLPAWNEERLLPRCLESLLAVDWPDLEIIVIAGGRDDTLSVARRYAGEKVLVLEQQPLKGKQVALREGLARARGEIIYLTDADCVVPREAFHAVIAPIASGAFDAATGGSLPLPEQMESLLVRYQWARDMAWGQAHAATAGGILGRHAAIRRSTLDRLGGFDAEVPSGTDYHLSQRLRMAGIPIAWSNSWVLSEFPERPAPYVRMWRRWIRNVLVQGVQTRSYREVYVTTVGVALSCAVLFTPLLVPLTTPWLLVPWLGLVGTMAVKRLRVHRAAGDQQAVATAQDGPLWMVGFVLLDSVAAVSAGVSALVPRLRRQW
jgi:cellulose synthase/poly-beta-1,6-N-acetylglucosamine synthase-like glycosyltransferase